MILVLQLKTLVTMQGTIHFLIPKLQGKYEYPFLCKLYKMFHFEVSIEFFQFYAFPLYFLEPKS